MDTKQYLRDFAVGDEITLFCVVRKREIRTARNGSKYLVLEVGDRSGRLSGNIWDDADNMYLIYPEGTIIKIRAQIDSYQGKKQLNIKKIRPSTPDDNLEPSDFLPVSATDPEKNFVLLQALAASLTNPWLKQLIAKFLDDPAIAVGFRKAPGGKLWHHDRIGGLLEHTLGICRLCRLLARLYPHIQPRFAIDRRDPARYW